MPLSSARSVYPDPRHAESQVPRPIPGGIRRYPGGVHLLLPPLGARGWFIACAVTEFDAWISIGRGTGAGVPGCRFSGGGMCGQSSVRLSISKWRAEIMGRSIYPASSST